MTRRANAIRKAPMHVGMLNQYASAQQRVEPALTESENNLKIEITPEFQAALDLINQGNQLTFVTGGAGTGKSTFIDVLRALPGRNVAVVAPTGVAALRVSGQTIHSFFRFPARCLEEGEIKKVKANRIYQKLDLLVIDEVSMVRADLLDQIAQFLSLNGGREGTLFGGKQVVFIGDLFQLPPVVATAEEKQYLAARYLSPYFFSARALQETMLSSVEFTRIFRQRNQQFASLLNEVRSGSIGAAALTTLNARCLPAGNDGALAVYLASTNRRALQVNEGQLRAIARESRRYQGTIVGEFNVQENHLPAPPELELKIGAQVMFTKNDSQHRWVNGTIGRVAELEADAVHVSIENEDGAETVPVKRVSWETYKYVFDELENRMVAQVVGSYTQFPLILAWAVTIHKAQGLTLDRVVLDLHDRVFAPGQLYVALSRCRTLEGLRLTRPIRESDILCDERIKRFYRGLREGEAATD